MKWNKTFPNKASYGEIAWAECISVNTMQKYILEYFEYGKIHDPYTNKVARAGLKCEAYLFRTELSYDAKRYLLALGSEDPTRPLYSYIDDLRREFNINVSRKYMSAWWKHWFQFEEILRKSSMIPNDKFSSENWLYYEFWIYINSLKNHTLFNFCDEKHLVDHNRKKLKVRKDLLTGNVPGTKVDGNFRDSHTLLCTISAKYWKSNHMYHSFNKGKTTARIS